MSDSQNQMLTDGPMKVEDQFYIMNEATLCLSDDQRDVAFNGLCHTLHKRWDVDKCLLALLMYKFGFVYMVTCCECGEEYIWSDSCPEC